MRRAHVSFAGTTVTIEQKGAAALRIGELLFSRVRSDLPLTPPRAVLSITSAADGGEFVLSHTGDMLLCSRNLGEFAERLQTEVAYHLIDGCTRGLVMHAGAVCELSTDGGVLLPAASGVGKSTLTAFLLTRGFCHLSDELAHLPADDLCMYGWSRPIELKHGGRALIEPLLRKPPSERTWLDTPTGCMLSPELLAADCTRSAATLRAIVFPHYAPGQARELREVSAAEASAMLLGACLNARNLPTHGLCAAARLARQVQAYSLRYGELDGVDEVLHRLVATH